MRSGGLLVAILLVGQGIVAGFLPLAQAGIVIGTFDATRAGPANLATGTLTTESRASLLTNFPSASFATTPTLTPAFLSGVDVLAITSVYSTVGITPLSGSEQSALFNYALDGGSVLLVADGYSPYVAAAQSIVNTFGLSIVDDGVTNLQPCTPLLPAHPIFDGPFGNTTSFSMYGAGNFTSLGSYATNLATMDSTGLPVLAVIEAGALGPGSGRIVIYSDATLFADPVADGFFADSETLYLNTIQYLIPEPSTCVLAAFGILCLIGRAWRRHACR